jgi:putative component of membrane protein insertase Oxa1/YidC/SpoIIIJ protein YidD
MEKLIIFILIRIIVLYQFVTPKRIREACRFDPSCSNYMILSLKKYGLIIGFKKGITRLKRCKWPNGGEDYP